jgi:predicted metal-binding membrane protein
MAAEHHPDAGVPTPLAGGATLSIERRAILAALLFLAAASWALLFWQASAGEMTSMSPTMGLGAPVFLAVWVVMMIAMMFPSAAPMVLVFHRVQAAKRRHGQAFVATWVFVAAYLVVWALSGVVAYALALAAEALARRLGISATAAARVSGVLFIVAGLYQFTPWKNVCLSHCRTPIGFIMTSWRDGVGGAFRMGLGHGAYCLGCCWLLFVILFPLGIMNVAAMAVVTAFIFAEKTFPWGRQIVRTGAAALVAYGVAVLAAPSLLPTVMLDMPTAMSAGSAGMLMPDGTTMKMSP